MRHHRIEHGALSVEFLGDMAEGLDHGGVEVLARALGDDGHRLLVGEGLLVDAFGHERVEHVGHGHDARGERDARALDARGVSGAVPLLVVVVRHLGSFLEVVVVHGVARVLLDFFKDVPALGGVALHDGEFFVGELARLVQDKVGHGNLADIVQRRRALEFCNVGVVEYLAELALALQFLRDGLDIERGLLNVVARAGVARFDHFCEVDNNFVLHLGDAFGSLL